MKGVDKSSRIYIDVKKAANDIGLYRLPTDNYLFYYEANGSQMQSLHDDALLIDAFPGSLEKANHVLQSYTKNSLSEVESICEKNIQFYNLWKITKDSISVQSDYFAHKYFFYADIDSGSLIASKITDIIRISRDLAESKNTKGIAWQLVFGFFPGSETVHKKILRNKANTFYSWNRDCGFLKKDINNLKLASVDPGISLDESVDIIYQSTVSSIRTRTDCDNQKANLIGLSGGFDSRLIAAVCAEEDIPIKAVTYGNAGHDETFSAKALARELKLDHEIIDYPENLIYDNLNRFMKIIEGHGDLQVAQICNLLSREVDSNSILHGYLGGPLSGHHVGEFDKSCLSSYSCAAEEIYHHHFNDVAYDKLKDLGINYSQQDFIHDIHLQLEEYADVYTGIRAWEFYNIQRDYIGSTLRLLGSQYHVIAPFYDEGVINSWLRIPMIALKNRYVFRQILLQKFPNIAVIPHSEEAYGITPSLRYQLHLLYRKITNNIHKRIIARTNNVKDYADPSYIWVLSHGGATAEQRRYLLNRCDMNSDYLKDSFDLNAIQDISNILVGDGVISRRGLDFTRRLYTLGEYAKYINGF